MAIRTPEAPGKSDRPERGRGIPAAALPQRRGSVEPIPQMSSANVTPMPSIGA